VAAFAGWAADRGVALPVIPDGCDPAWHLFSLLMPTPAERDALIAHLANHGIMAVFHYLPLHASPMGLRLGGRPGDCPVTEAVSDRLVRLPFHRALSDDDLNRIIEAVIAFPGVS
jgi:dTDP-4-amino-4,6-dideoxygalactose transaminase